MVKKGDTLIEVTLAIGIFSLVAIAVVSVVNGSTSGAQSSLETTLAREEIDIQAESLRFIQSSYINSVNNTNSAPTAAELKYKELWQKITSLANPASNMDYSPGTCQELYDKEEGNDTNKIQQEKAFVINSRKLGINNFSSGWLDEVVASSTKSPELFAAASTYPRIIYGLSDENKELVDLDPSSTIFKVEGLYITAVEGPETTVVVENGVVEPKKAAAYYDFYIRSCWYGPGANTPSTISTVMRLYNPDVVKVNQTD